MMKRVMVAGVGNVLMMDDGFGSEVVRQLLAKPARAQVVLKDYGTGGLKLAYDLMPGYDALILVDAVRRGEAPGTLYVIEPAPGERVQGGALDPHGADLSAVLRLIQALNVWPPKTLIVGCEPGNVDDAEIGLTSEVQAAVERAVALVEEKIAEAIRGEQQ